MSLYDHPDTIKLLANLLKPPDEDSDSEDDRYSSTAAATNFGPANIGSKKTIQKPSENLPEKPCEIKPQVPEVEDKDEVEKWLEKQEREDNDVLDNRIIPKYEIIYKQAVGTEDVFFQMNNKTAASMSCEDMIIKIELPDETVDVDHMDLSVKENQIDLQTPKYRLKLPLIHNVDPNKGKAAFDSEKKILTLTLRMRRELDFVNF